MLLTLILTIGVGLGGFLAFQYHDTIQDVLNVHNALVNEKSLHNTVLPESCSKYIPDVCLGWLETGKFLLDLAWISFEQWLMGSCVLVDPANQYYRVRFVIHHKPYWILVRPVAGPEKYLVVQDSDRDDVTELVNPYLRGLDSVVKPLTPRILLDESHFVRVSSLLDSSSRQVDADEAF